MFNSNASSADGGANYVEDVFSTYLYTGNSSSQTITNNIDLSTKGGLVWTFCRSNAQATVLQDTARGVGQQLLSNSSSGQSLEAQSLTSFNTNGFTLGSKNDVNYTGYTFASWTFREQEKFFDVVTYTGDGTNRSINHNLKSTPGFVIVKRTDTNGDWYCGITAFGGSDYLVLNSTAARATSSTVWNSTVPTSTTFTVGTNAGVNASGGTYVAYLFANNAGGFGLTGTDSVISTTLVSSAGSGNTTVNLGFEPQFLMLKKTATTSDWFMYDTMRGMSYSAGAATLLANNLAAETTGISVVPTSTGFTAALDNSFTYFCLAIRKGPMKVPTDPTKVFAVTTFTGVDTAQTAGFPVDFVPNAENISTSTQWQWVDRIRGLTKKLESSSTGMEGTVSDGLWASNTQVRATSSGNNYKRSYPMFRRAPSFFDQVCWTTTQTGFGITAITHNLGVVPELIITKARNTSGNWMVRVEGVTGNTSYLRLNSSDGLTTFTLWGTPTSTTFSEDEFGALGSAGTTAVAYLFATCAGVSKVGSYTGTGTTQTINCGFTAGARFVLIKRTDSTGDWYVWDTARGLIPASDPYLLFNTTGAEVGGTDYVDTTSVGFDITSTAPAAINANGGTYIFLAIA